MRLLAFRLAGLPLLAFRLGLILRLLAFRLGLILRLLAFRLAVFRGLAFRVAGFRGLAFFLALRGLRRGLAIALILLHPLFVRPNDRLPSIVTQPIIGQLHM